MSVDLGKISITPKGVYNSSSIYEKLDLISHEYSSYLSLVDNNMYSLSDTSKWQKIAEGLKGDKGETGFRTIDPFPLNINDPSPTVEGWYKPESIGIYNNANGLEALSGYDTLFYFDGNSSWEKAEFPQILTVEDGSVTTKKTDFAESEITVGKNIANPANLLAGKYVDWDNGNIADNPNYKLFYKLPIKENTSYYFTVLYHMAWYNAQGNFISGIYIGGSNVGLVSPPNAAFVSGSFLMTNNQVQIEKGTVATSYEPFTYSEKIVIENLKVTLDQAEFIKDKLVYGKNRFDKTKVTPNKFVNAFTGNLDDNPAYEASDFCYIEDMDKIILTDLRHVAFYTKDKVYISGREYGGDIITRPTNAVWIRASLLNGAKDTYQIESGERKTEYESYKEPIVKHEIPDLYIPPVEEVPDSKPFPKILISQTNYLMSGIQYNFYFNSFIVAPLGDQLNNYYCSSFSYRGKFLEKKLRVIPTDDFSIVFKVENSEKELTKSVEFLTAPVNSGSGVNRKVCVIGDSTINQEVIIDHLANFFSTDVMDITLIGTRQTTAGNKHEGRSGWTIKNYIEDSSVSGINNPFYNNGFDFNYYLSNTSQTLGVNDWVFIQLGINDLYASALMDGSQTNEEINNRLNSMKINLELMINSIKSHNSNIRIGIIQTFPPSYSQDGTGNLLNSSFYSSEYYFKKGISKWWEYLLGFYDTTEKRNERIYLVGANAVLDRENNFQTGGQSIDNYNSTIVSVQLDDVHPASAGYKQVSDTYIGTIKYFG